MENLVRLIYVSDAVASFSPQDLSALLHKSRANNAARGLSGLLLYSGGHFIQVLEGTADAVAERYDVIKADARHARVSRLLCEVTSSRLFGRWTMGTLDAEAVSSLDRLQLRRVVEWAADPTLPTDRTQVHKLLENFRDQLARSRAA